VVSAFVFRLLYWISSLLRPTRPTEAICSDYARAAIGRWWVLNGRKLVICHLLE